MVLQTASEPADLSPQGAVVPPYIQVVYDFSFLRLFFNANARWVGPAVSGFDIETEGLLNPHDGEVATIQIEMSGRCWVVHVRAPGTLLDVPDVELLRAYLEANEVCKVIHNAKFELKWMMKYFGLGLHVDNFHDTIIAEYILAAGFGFGVPSTTSFEFDSSILGLGQVMARRYSVEMDKDEALRVSFRRHGLLETIPAPKDPLRDRSETCQVDDCPRAPRWLAGGARQYQICDYHRENKHEVKALKALRRWDDYPERPQPGAKMFGDLSARQVLYAAFDVLYMPQLYVAQVQEMNNHVGLRGDRPYPALFRLDCQVAECLARMELRGIPIDRRQAFKTHRTLMWQADTLRQEIVEALRLPGDTEDINPGSRDQMLPRLAQLGINLPDYRSASLERAASHPVIRKLLTWKQVEKLSTFTKTLLLEAHPKTDCVHSNFNQTKTATGRLSSSAPNFQNIPSKSKLSAEIRKCVMARPGRVLVIADYSNIEVRIIAEVTRDENLVRLFNEDKDMHCMTAAYMMGVSYDEMYRKYKIEKLPEFIKARNNSKVPNFGLGYKASVDKLRTMAWVQYGLDWTEAEAAEQHRKWFELYPGVGHWHTREQATVRDGKGPVTVENALGRRRTMQRRITVTPNAKALERGEQPYSKGALPAVLNFPIQSASAEMTKRAMATLSREVDVILQVHDELVVECDEADADRVSQLVHDAMVKSGEGILTVVPNVVEPMVSKFWKK
jgi:DNA polymerase-1